MPWALLLILVVLGIASKARAGTDLPRKTPSQKWVGCDAPAKMRPRPSFRCGQELSDDSTGVSRRVKVDHLAAAPVKGGFWLWTYYMSDGTFAHADSLKE